VTNDAEVQPIGLFVGQHQGAENWACIASLVETCRLCGVEPQAYLTDGKQSLYTTFSLTR
jgi:IS66 C-terminal element